MREKWFGYLKTKEQTSFLYFLNSEFVACKHLLWLQSLVCIKPGRQPRLLNFLMLRLVSKKQNFLMMLLICFNLSEITHRFQTAKPAIRQTLLKYLLPWLHNMELVDPSLPQSSPLSNFLVRLHDNYTETFKPPLKGEGWGSQEATKMVLNNLFYITVKVGFVGFIRTLTSQSTFVSVLLGWIYCFLGINQ